MIRRGTAVPGLLDDEIAQFQLPGAGREPPMPMAKPGTTPDIMRSLSPIIAARSTGQATVPQPALNPGGAPGAMNPTAVAQAAPGTPMPNAGAANYAAGGGGGKSWGRGILDWLNEPITQDEGLLSTASELGVDTEGGGMSRGMYAARALKGFADGMSASLHDDIAGNFMGQGQMTDQMLAAQQENTQMLRDQIADRVSIMKAKQVDAKANRPVVVPPGASLRDLQGGELYTNPAKDKEAATSEIQKLLAAREGASPEQRGVIDARITKLNHITQPGQTNINVPWIGKDEDGNIIGVDKSTMTPTVIDAATPNAYKPTPTELKLKSEAERVASVGQGSLAEIRRALELNERIPDGYESLAQQGVDYFTNKERYAESKEYDQLVKSTLLPRMKEIFGANPTEGERAAMTELGAIGTLPVAARKAALERAHKSMEDAVNRNVKMAKDIAAGKYGTTPNLPEEEPEDDEEEELPEVPAGFR